MGLAGDLRRFELSERTFFASLAFANYFLIKTKEMLPKTRTGRQVLSGRTVFRFLSGTLIIPGQHLFKGGMER